MVAWANLTTVGVMPAAKWDFILTSVTNLLATYKPNGLVIIIHCNRASDTGRTRMFKVPTLSESFLGGLVRDNVEAGLICP